METIKTTAKQKNILYVENDRGSIRDFEDYIEKTGIKEKFGLNIIHANDTKEALKKIAELQLDLIILEIILPVISGYNLIKVIKGNKIPIIVYTKLKSSEDLAKIAASGVENIFIKNVNQISELLDAICAKNDYKIDLDKKVNELQIMIKSLTEEDGKNEIKLLQCPKCNTIVAQGSHFCNNCGYKISKKTKTELKTKTIETK